MRLIARRLPLLFLPILTACSSFSDFQVTDYVTPYRVDVRQGNYVTQEMVAQLRAGQTQQQVRFILGTPLLVDAFHKDRWDYIYRFQPGHGDVQSRRLSVYFTDGKLTRVGGDVDAASSEDLSPSVSQSATRVLDLGEAAEAKPDGKATDGKATDGKAEPKKADK